jgi:hypothetical protein
MIRRELIAKGLAAMTGLGKPMPSRFPQRTPQSVGVAAGPGIVVRANKVIVFGPNNGVFLYNGTPALGNPPVEWMSQAPKDPFGNVLPQQGVATKQSNLIAALFDGGLQIYQLGQFAQGQVVAGNPGSIRLNSGQSVSTDVPASMAVETTTPAIIDGAANPQVILYSPTALTLQGAKEWYPPSGDTSGVTDVTAINKALANGWAVDLTPGTYYVNIPVSLPGNGAITAPGPQGTTIRAVSSMSAVVAAKGWLTNTTTTDNQVNVAGFSVDGNNLATYGLVGRNQFSHYQQVWVTGATSDQFRLDYLGANGIAALTTTAVGNWIVDCRLFNTGSGSGFRSNDLVGGGKFTDGYLTDTIVNGFGMTGTASLAQIDVAAGWAVTGNHLYSAQGNGLDLGRCFNTDVGGNYIETWGFSATAGFYLGIALGAGNAPRLADNGNGTTCHDNRLSYNAAPGNAGTFIDGISVNAAAGATGTVVVANNTIGNTQAVSAQFRGAIVLQCQNATATLNAVTEGNQGGSGWNTTVDLIPNGGVINHTAGF